MKVSTSLVVAAVLVALSTSVNAKTASTSVFASEPSDSDPTEELSLSSESTAEQSDKDNSKSLVDTKDATGDPPEDLYDFDAPCASDDGDTKKGLTGEQSEEDSSTPLYDFDAPCEPDGGDTKGGLTDEQSDEDSSTPLYDFSSPSCASDPDQIGGFTDEEKAIWIERHNYFRVAALPWAAGNMKRMNWDDELAKEAASTAESCTAETTAGLNVFKATSTDSSSVIDEALNDWAVKPALSNIGSVVPPAKEGDSAARGIANGEKPPTVPPAATTATPTSSSLKTPSKTPSTPSSSKTHSVSSNEDVGDTKKSATEKTPSSSKTHSVSSDEDVGDTKKSATEKTPSSSKTHSVSSDEDVGDTKKSATEKTPSSSKTHSVSSDEDVGDTKTSAMDETPSPSTKTEEDLVPGTVKASSDKGSTFTNEKPSTKNPTSSSPTSTSSKPDNDESLPPTTPMSGSSPAPSTMTATQHKGVESNISVAGITGISVLVIVCIAAFGVVMSYKRNQRRQREIMRDGGIRVD
ncbi:unnamed protein product [Peronospora farinosa]|uniref:SCP domain-containing protein n=1 Tax=Peronospora farinosa TaxID=134698 RepID=A0AAV0SQD6_9STRA|nr:unnamed protein product [Peronospora farinosa]